MNKIIHFCLTLFITGAAAAQSVSTYAGKQYVGSGQFSGVGSMALAAEEYSSPTGICLDTNRRIYVADMHNVSVLTNGKSYTRGGHLGDPNGPDGVGDANGNGLVSRFATPSGVAVRYSDNNVFVCDKDNALIRRGNAYVNSSQGTLWSKYSGVRSFIGGHKDGALGVAEFSDPYDIVITSKGIIYISDFGNDVIRKISGSTVSTIIGSPGNSGDKDGSGATARLEAPTGLYLENDNSLLIADRNNKKIRRVNLSTNTMTTVVSGLDGPTDVVVMDGLLYIADNFSIKSWDGASIKVVAGKAGFGGFADGALNESRFRQLDLMTVDKVTKSIYVVDQGNNVVRKVLLDNTPVADFIASKTAISLNETIQLKSTSTFSTSQTWSITPPDYVLQAGSKLTDKEIFVSFTKAQSYSVVLAISNGTQNDSKTKNSYINVSDFVNDKPVADFMAMETEPIAGTEVYLVDLSSNDPTGWRWSISPITGLLVTGGTSLTSRNPKITFTVPGKYSVTLKVTNANGDNTSTKTDYITVAASALKTPAKLFDLFPNPTTGIVTFKGVNAARVWIYDLSGKRTEIKVYENQVNLDAFSNGIYTLLIQTENGLMSSQKVIKTN
jgi:PKD repeat protein